MGESIEEHLKKKRTGIGIDSIMLLVPICFIPLLALSANTSASDDVGLALAFTLYTVYCSCAAHQPKAYRAPMILGASLRLIVLLYDLYTSNPLNLPMVGGELRSDPHGYFNAASGFANGETITYGGYFSYLIGLVFIISSPSRIVGELVVVTFSVATFHVVANCMDSLGLSDKKKESGMYLLCLMPNYALLSVVLRRETVIAFFISLSLLYFIRWFNRGGTIDFSLSILFSLTASLFHGAAGVVAVGYVVVHLIYDPWGKSFNLTPRSIATSIVVIAIIAFLYIRFGEILFTKLNGLESVEDIADGVGRGNSNYAAYVGNSKTIANFIRYTIPRMLYFMFSPFPWQWRGLADVLTFCMSSCVYAMIVIKAIHSHNLASEKSYFELIICLLIILFIVVFVFGWGVSNVGTATRHRDKFISIFVILYTLCSKSTRKRTQSF